MYENNAFRESAWAWARDLKAAFEAYRHIRGIFNPCHRLGEFWSGHLMGGPIDPDAGDGTKVESCLPIETKNAAIRPALATLWHDSNMATLKDVLTLFGPVLGDVGLEVIDDPIRQRVTLHVRHPGHVKWVDRDDAGKIKSYILEEYRYDPRPVPIAQFNPILDPRTLRYPCGTTRKRSSKMATSSTGHSSMAPRTTGGASRATARNCPRNGPCRTRSSRSSSSITAP